MASIVSRIVGPDGEPIRYEVLDQEIAVGSTTGIRQVWHASVANNLTPTRLASILSAAADGEAYEYLTLAEEMEERDLHYASVLGTRRLAVAGLVPRVDALTDEAADVRIADAVRELLTEPAFADAVFDLTDAIGKGYAVCEIIWDRSAKPWRPVRLEYRDPRFFRYDRETGRELRLIDEADPVDGIALAPYKFIVHRPRIRSGLPIRGGLARLAAPGYMCKAWSWKDWMAFADIFGMPMRIGTYGPNAKEADIRKLMSAVANLGSDAAAVVPESTRIAFEQAANTAGAGDFFEKLASWWDRQISKGVLGQTMTADDGASLSQAKVHNDVRLDLLAADALALQNTLQRDLVRPFVDLNFGPGRYPQLVLQVPEPEDTGLLIDALTKLVPMGLKVEQSIIRDKLGLPDPAEGPDVELLHAPEVAAPVPPQALNRAISTALNRDAPPVDYLEALAQQVAAKTGGITDAWVATIREEVQAAASFEDLLLRLADLQSSLPIDQLGDVLTDAFGLSHRAGMSDAADESDA